MVIPGGLARRIVRWSIFVVAQVVVVAILLEIGVRIAASLDTNLHSMLYASGSEVDLDECQTVKQLLDRSILGFRPCQEYYGFTLNSRSLRTSEYSRHKPEGALRVLALGDSFTFASGGLPSGQGWPVVLEGMLREQLHRPVEVLRMGVPGTSTPFQLRLFQLEGSQLEPDIVILAFFVGNDLLEQQGVPPAGCGMLSAGLAKTSLAFRAARNLYRLHAGVERAPGPGDAAGPQTRHPRDCSRAGLDDPSYATHFDPMRPTFSVERYDQIQEHRLSILLRSRRRCFDHMLTRAVTAIDALDQEVMATGASFLVMLIPDEMQVDAEARAGLLARVGIAEPELDIELPQRELGRELARSGIEVVDLLPELRDTAAVQTLYLPRNTHWSAAGNRIAAEALARHLEAEGCRARQDGA